MALFEGTAEAISEWVAWRHDFHAHPELMFDVERTAGVVADLLRAFGCDEVVAGLGRTGVVGLIRGREAAGRTVALRADMDALPISEETAHPYVSTTAGRMHACGHDGHMAMLLAAARHLCATRRFSGTVAVVFQPAEEGGGGARVMIEDGLLERFGIADVYGMHNLPGLPVGRFAVRPGPIMAAADRFEVGIKGRGGHAAMPHLCTDPVLAAAHMVVALQSIVARNADPLDSCVLSVTQMNAGAAQNAIPGSARLAGTARVLRARTGEMVEARARAVVAGIADAFGVEADVTWHRGYPVTVNDTERTAFCVNVAAQVVGETHVDATIEPKMFAEDFSFMLEKRPGCFLFIGNGDSAGLHSPDYDFDDSALPYGVSYWIRLVESVLPSAA